MISKTISVIIPVHNAARSIEKTAQGILNQKYKDIELILVENGSIDSSWDICERISQKDARCIALQSNVKSTLIARRVGIKYANGDYIAFSDADDEYQSSDSIGNMVQAIIETGSDIVQFGNIVNSFGKKTKRLSIEEKQTISRSQLLKEDIAGAMGGYGQKISPAIWNKIYRGEVLKSIVNELDKPLIYAEDLYINCCSCFSKETNSFSFYPICEYIYHSGIGVSGDGIKAAEKTFEAYRYFKPKALELAKKYGAGEKPVYLCQRETLRFLDALIHSYIIRGDLKSKICEKIRDLWKYEHVVLAKKYFINYMENHELDDEMTRFTNETDAEKYYDYCISRIDNLPYQRIQYEIKSKTKSILRFINQIKK